MVFAAFLQKIGLLDVLAPNSSAERRAKDEKKELEKKRKARLQAEEQKRVVMLEERVQTQYKAEEAARERNQFAKKQRVLYTAADQKYDAVIVDVHFDDHPEHPYYTIKYKRLENNTNCEVTSGKEAKNIIEVEKQTNPERLTSVRWDKDKTRKLLR